MVVQVDEITNRDISQKLPLEGVLLPTIDGARDEANYSQVLFFMLMMN